MASLDLHRQKLLTAWQSLSKTLLVFAQKTQADLPSPAWAGTQILPPWASSLAEPSDLMGIPDRDVCMAVLARLEFFDGQPAGETLVMPGLLAASNTVLEAAHAVNAAKDAFKAAILELRALRVDVDHDPAINSAIQQDLISRPPLIGAALRRSGLARLALKQCYRHIPILPARPRSLRWTWARTKSITRLSVPEAEALLKQAGSDPGIDLQLLRLAALPRSEPLAQVQDCAPHLRANVVFASAPEPGAPLRRMINAPVPVLYRGDSGEPLPLGCQDLRLDAERKVKPDRKRRRDQKLESEPFLPAIRVYRYQAGTEW